MTLLTSRTLLAIAIAATCAASALAQMHAAPSNDQIKAQVDAFWQWLEITPREQAQSGMVAKADELLAEIHINELSPAQIEDAAVLLLRGTDSLAQTIAHLADLIDDQSPDGALAAVMKAWAEMNDARRAMDPEKFAALVAHPGLPATLQTGRGSMIFQIATIHFQAQFDPAKLGHISELDSIRALLAMMPDKLSGQGSSMAADFLDAATATYSTESAQAFDDARRSVIASLTHAKNDTDDEFWQSAIDQRLKGLTSIGKPAPSFNFLWSEGRSELQSLDDLKGQVVLVDFWATWCGPCIRSFPRVRDLVAHYKDSPVTVLGVTSLQGTHYAPSGQRISTKGNPDREFELMSQFRAEMDMTWPVAFSDRNVYDPEFGVDGIPHIAIIAPDGTLRFNGLNPLLLSDEQEHAMIDAILKEFDLPIPDATSESHNDG